MPVDPAGGSAPWIADLGDGRHQNPVPHADYSDPDAIRVGDTYYMTASSFNAAPGLPLLTSSDMVNWDIANTIGNSKPNERLSKEKFINKSLSPRYCERPMTAALSPLIGFHLTPASIRSAARRQLIRLSSASTLRTTRRC